jgi:hypothetical protein
MGVTQWLGLWMNRPHCKFCVRACETSMRALVECAMPLASCTGSVAEREWLRHRRQLDTHPAMGVQMHAEEDNAGGSELHGDGQAHPGWTRGAPLKQTPSSTRLPRQ